MNKKAKKHLVLKLNFDTIEKMMLIYDRFGSADFNIKKLTAELEKVVESAKEKKVKFKTVEQWQEWYDILNNIPATKRSLERFYKCRTAMKKLLEAFDEQHPDCKKLFDEAMENEREKNIKENVRRSQITKKVDYKVKN